MPDFTFTFNDHRGYSFDPASLEVAGGARLQVADGGYSQDNPALTVNRVFSFQELALFQAVVEAGGGDQVRFLLLKDDAPYYHDGAAWIESDGSYSQTNAAEEIEAAKSQMNLADRGQFQIKAFFHSESGATTPELKRLSISTGAASRDLGDTAKLRNKQLRDVASKIFVSAYTFKADLYRVALDTDGRQVLADEIHIGEKEAGGTLNDQEATLSYQGVDRTKIMPCKVTDEGKFGLVRQNTANEFEQDRIFHYLIEEENIPLQSVLEFQRPKELDGSDMETITLIKVGEAPAGDMPIAGIVHAFVYFQGDL